jgi:8-oxo-dGTP pyrophosphatase MutT (NUDIX family)
VVTGDARLPRLSAAELAELTRRRLAARSRRDVSDGPLVRAAVLVPIVDRGEPVLIFAKRTELVSHHKGQIAFPGGVVDESDPSSLAAALRECEEEIGLAPEAVQPLGALDDSETVATQFVITPWVGLARAPARWRPDGLEIERVLEVPFAALAEPGAFRVEHWERDGTRRPVYFFDWAGETIWGATARILVHYLDVVRDAAR